MASPAAVTITGSDFSATSNSVTFGGVAGTVTANATGSITVSPPNSAAAGTVDVVVTNNSSGLSQTRTAGYRYLTPPTVTATFSPTSFSSGASSTFTMRITNPNAVQINGVAVAPAALPSGLIAQSGTLGTTCANGTITLSSNALSYSGGTFSSGFACNITVNVTSTTPNNYSYTTGTASANGTATTSVALAGANATGTVTVNASSNANLSNLVLSQGTLNPSFSAGTTSYTAAVANGVSSITVTPTAGGPGATVTVNGSPVTSGSPSGAIALAVGTNTINTLLTAQDGITTKTYTVMVTRAPPAPTVTNVSPVSGPVSGNTPVTITGIGFSNAAATGAVRFGASVATYTIDSDTQITATSPSHVAGTVDVTVTHGGGTSATSSADRFTFVPAPTISSLSPTGGSTAGGTSLTLSGTNLTGATLTVDGASVTPTANNGTSMTFVTPSHPSAGAVAVTVTTIGGSATTGYTYIASLSLSPTGGALPGATAGVAYSQTFTASGGTSPFAFSITAGAVPAGVTLSAGGVLAGTSTAVGIFNFTITATDSTASGNGGPLSVSQSYSLTVDAPTITLSPTTLGNGTIGAAYSGSVSASGGTATYSYAVTAGALPAGISLSTGGALSGTPTAAGSFTFTITATDSSTGTGAPFTGSRGYTITIAAPTIAVSPTTLPSPTAGVAYSQNVTATGGTATYGFAVTAGALPAGLNLSSTGTLSGTPSAGGNFSFTITATDSSTGTGAPFAGSRTYSFTVAPATIAVNPATLPNGRAGVAYSQTLTATGGNGAYSFAVTAGALPPGWSLSTGGVLSGTATSSDTYSFTITATDSSTGTGAPHSGSRGYSVDVLPPNFSLTPPTLSATVGQSYTGNFLAGGGTAPYTYSRAGGPLPTGMTLATDGTLSGTPTAAGTFNFIIIARDSTGGSAAPFQVGSGYTFTVSAATLALAPASLANGTVAANYSQSVTASGGTAPYTYTLEPGSTLPAGITLSTGGTLSGTPMEAGTFNFTIRATDSSTGAGAPYSVTRNYSVTMAAPAITLTPTTLPAGVPGAAYSQTLTASGGTGGYTYTLDSGTLPAGVTLSTGGALSGTPTASGAFNFTVKATDSSTGTGAPFAGTQAYTLTIGTPTITVDTTTLPAATVAGAYSQPLSVSGGTGPYSYAVTAGSLPAGTMLSTGGVISGTPTAGGVFNFTVTATDSSGGSGPFSGSRSLTLTVNAPTIALAPAALPNAGVAANYNQTITASGGTSGYTFAVTAGSLPAGFTLAPNGTLSGTATAGGTFNFTVTATDSSTGTGPYAGSKAYSLAVDIPSMVLNPATLTDGAIAVAYSGSVSATGGTVPYSYAVTSGALPAGVTLSPAGVLSGTPTAGGSYSFTVTATDSSTGSGAPYTVSRGYTLNITAATVNITPPALPNGQMEVAYSQALTASGGTASYSYAVTAGALPAGMTLSPMGTLAGTPTAHGTFNFTVTATDSSTGLGPYTGSRGYGLVIAAPAVPAAADVSATVAYASSANPILPSLSGGAATSVAVASAPAHGTATVSGMAFSYTPAPGYYGADSFTYTATNDGGTSAPATASITVGLPPAPVAADKSGVAVPYASNGTAIDLSGSVTGVHSSIAIGTAPAHGTVTVAGDVVTYTPAATYYGADSFTYTATGPGGTSAPATVTLTVATPAAPTAANKSGVTVGYNSAGTAIDLAPSVSGVHSTLTVATAPTHGTTTVNGDVVTYTPTVGYYGADSFTYTVTGPGGTSAAATVSLTVATPPPPAAAPGTGSVAGSTTTAGTSVSINLSALVTGVYDTIQIASQPQHGTVTLSAVAGPSLNPSAAAPASPYIAVYTPAANYAGTDSFTFTATGPGGTSSPATVTITVVGQVPVAVAKVANTGDGQMVSVMLTDGAIRGPFTGATVVSVSPASSASTAIVATGNGGYRLDVTPNNRFGGQIVVTYTLSNVFGASAPSTVTLTVQARPDPRNDPNVGAISDAQSEATRRFTRAQVSNFMRRTEQLHNGGGQAGLAMGMRLNSRDGMVGMQRPDDKNWGLAITDRMRASGEDPAIGQFANNPQSPLSRPDQLGYGRAIGPNGNGTPGAGASKKTADTNEDGTRRTGSVATWAGGAIDIGTRDKTTDRTKVTATTAGLSAGADVKLADGIVVGLGGGYGNDLSRIGTAAQVRGTSTIYAAYASLQPAEGTFIDGVIGRGQLDFTTRRIAAAVNATARGSRDGSYTVAAISLGIDRNGGGALQWSLYGRGEYMDADLDAYAESGAGRYNLRFDAREVRSITGTIGGRVEYRQKVSFGSITPRVRAEWNHEFADVDAQWLDYADIPGAAAYALTGNGWKREQLQLSLGTRFDILKGGWSFDFETGLRAGQGEKAGTLQIRLTKEF